MRFRHRKAGLRRYSTPQKRLAVEPLEDRSMLSVTLGPITGPDAGGVFDVPSGKDLYVPLVGSDTAGTSITYTASSNNANVQATVLTGNPTLELDVSGTTAGGQAFSGTMTFQLFENIAPQTVQAIINDVNSGLYNGASFYRAETSTDFELIQGGVEMTSGKTLPADIPDEFNVAASFNSGGLLAMANTGQANSGSSEFFVTAPNVPLANEPQSSLNYGYTIFGQILTGQDIYNDILNIPTQNSNGIDYATNPVTITSASIITDNQHTVLQISEPSTFTGNATITVTANGSDATSATRTFKITAAHPTTSQQPLFLKPVSNLNTANGTSVTVQLSATAASSLSGDQLMFSVTGTDTFTGAPTNVNAIVTSVSGNTATITLTPTNAANNSVIDLVAHVDDAATASHGALHDALPFSVTVGSLVSVTSATSLIGTPNETAAEISGTGEIGATISVFASDGTHQTTAQTTTVDLDGNWSITGINVTALKDGQITYSATATDSRGNTATATKAATKDTVAPTVSITSVTSAITSANETNTSASGKGTVGATISIVATDNNSHSTTAQTTTVGSDGKWTIGGINVAGLNDGTITYTVTASDAANNTATTSKTASKNTAGSTAEATVTTVTSDHSSGSTYGQSVSFTAAISAVQGGTPTGTVQFQVDGVNFGAAETLTGGAASISDSSLSAGSHTITALYINDSTNFISSQDDVVQNVAKASLIVTGHSLSKVFGAAVPSLTADYSGFVNTDTSASLTKQPTLSTNTKANSAVGNYTISVSGATDSNYTISFVAGTLSVTQSQTTVGLNSSSFAIDPSEGDTLTATVTPVSPGSGTITGIVTFLDGTTTLGTGNVGSGGTATLNVPSGTLAAGPHNITAVYGGSTNFAASPASAPASVTVGSTSGTGTANGSGPTVTIGGATKAVRGQSVTYTFTATDSDSSEIPDGFAFSINWGDGHTQTVAAAANNGTQTLQHVYTTSHSFHIQATATDQDGNVSTAATHDVAISAIAMENDTVNTTKKDLFIGGTTGGDTIFVLPWSGNQVGVLMNGHWMGSFSASQVYVFGQAGNDMIMISPIVHTPTVLDGGAGNDHLFGGSGRNLMIGGTGADTMMGGRSDDVFIPGSSTYEGNAQALNSIMAEWSSNQSFATRKADLNDTGSGTGSNGQIYLTTGPIDPTVLSDGAVDRFFGSGGHDWFLPG
jgi:cyclophilin family peptidyl-prolyl cis-trans isomerase